MATDGDDAGVILTVPQETIAEVDATLPQLPASLLQESADAGLRTPVKAARDRASSSGGVSLAGSATKAGRADAMSPLDDVDGSETLSLRDEGGVGVRDDGAVDALYVADPRYAWSLFEVSAAPTAASGAASGTAGAASTAIVPAASPASGGGGILASFSPFKRRARDELAAPAPPSSVVVSTAAAPARGAAGGAPAGSSTSQSTSVSGIDIDALAKDGLMHIAKAIAAASAAAGSSGSSVTDGLLSPTAAGGAGADAGDGSAAGDLLADNRAHCVSSVAVCMRNRDRAAASAIRAISTMEEAGAASSGGGARAASSTDGASSATTPAAGGIASVVSGLNALIQAYAFYYVGARVEAVAMGNAGASAPPPADMPREQRQIKAVMDNCAAVITFVVRAPVELQNALACDMAYEIAVPRSVYEAISGTAAGAESPATAVVATTSTAAAVDATKKSSGGFFSRFRRGGGAAPEASTPATPTDTASPAGGAAPETLPDMIVFSSGSLGPAQSLSILYAHAGTPPAPAVGGAGGGAAGSAYRSRIQYKQRLSAARYVRALSFRIRLPETGFEWSPWTGLWTPHDSPSRAAAIATSTAAASLTDTVVPLASPLVSPHGEPHLQHVQLADGAGGQAVLHVEHAASSALSVFMRAGGQATGATMPSAARAHPSDDAHKTNTLAVTVFCRFWLVNAAGLPLVYSTAVAGTGTSASSKERSIRTVKVAAGQAQPVLEECFENQRFAMYKWTSSLLPTDRPFWSDRYGSPELRSPDTFKLPSGDWQWRGAWNLDMRGDVDADGFEYNVDFPRNGDAGWTGRRTPAHFVRRRRWTRVRVPPSASEEAQAALASLTAREMGSTGAGLLQDLGGVAGAGNRSVVGPMGAGEPDGFDGAGAGYGYQPIIPARASTLLALGVYMYGPGEGLEDSCAVRVADSDWSLPFSLRSVGRPGLVVVRDRLAERDALAETVSTAKPKLQHQYEFAVSTRPCAQVRDSGAGVPFAHVFHRTMLVTVSPRIVFVNRLDNLIARLAKLDRTAEGGGAGGGADDDGTTAENPLHKVGIYVLQVAQCGPHDASGVSRPAAEIAAYLNDIGPPSQSGADLEYDIGMPLDQRLRAATSAAASSSSGVDDARLGAPGREASKSSLLAGAKGALVEARARTGSAVDDDDAEDESVLDERLSGLGSVVPVVLTVPPGVHAPFHWPIAPTTPGATERVCVRVARLVRKPITRSAAAGAASGGGGSSRKYRTVVVPVTDWSGGFPLGQVDEIPLRLRPLHTPVASALDCTAHEIVLRVSVRAHRQRGTALVEVTSDAGLQPLAATVQEWEDSVASQGRVAHSMGTTATATRLLPLAWTCGVGETSAEEVLSALDAHAALVTARRRTAMLPDAPTLQAPALAHPPPAPLFRIDNHTLDSFSIRQRGVTGATRPPIHVPPRTSIVFAWDEPDIPPEVLAAALAASAGGSGTAAKHGAIAGLLGLAAGAGKGLTFGLGAAAGSEEVAATSKLRITLVPTTVPVSSAAGADGASSGAVVLHAGAAASGGARSSIHAGATAAGGDSRSSADGGSTHEVEIDFTNVALSASLRLPAGRVIDEDAMESSIAGSVMSLVSRDGTIGAASTTGSAGLHRSKPLAYGTHVLLKTRATDKLWAVAPLTESRLMWLSHSLQDGTFANSAATPNGVPIVSSFAIGTSILAAQCRLADSLTAGAAGSASTASTSAASGDSDSAKDATRGAGGADGEDSATFMFEGVSSYFGWSASGAAAASKPAATAPGGRRATMMRRARSSSLEGVFQSMGLGSLATNTSTGTTVQFGDLVMIRYDAAAGAGVAAAFGETDAPADGAGGSGAEDGGVALTPLTAVQKRALYLVAHNDGKLEWLQREAALAVMRQTCTPNAGESAPQACSVFLVVGGAPGTDVKLTKAAPATAGASKQRKGLTDAFKAPADGEDGDADDGAPTSADEPASNRFRGAGSGFGLLPIAFADRLVEGVTDPAPALRQCRLPALSAAVAPPPAAAPADSGAGGTGGPKVFSSMQRRRMAAKGLAAESAAGGSAAMVPIPSSAIPAELRLVASGTSLPRLGSLVPDHDALTASSTASTTPDTTQALLEAVLKLPLLTSLPPTCVMVASPLTSVVLPARVIAARVGFDGPTRVLTLQSHVIGSAVKRHTAKPGSLAASRAASLASLFALDFSLSLPLLTLSVVDSAPQELALVSLEQVATRVTVAHPYIEAELSIAEVQIDNQLPGANFPVVLARSAEGGVGADGTLRPFLHTSIVFQAHQASAAVGLTSGNGASSGSAGQGTMAARILHFPYVSILLQEMDLKLEEVLLRRLAAVLPSNMLGVDAALDDEFGDGGGEADVDAIVAKRRTGGLRGVSLVSHSGGLGLSGMRNHLAASIVKQATTTSGKRSSIHHGGGKLGNIVGTKNAEAMRRKLHVLSAHARRQARRDMARFRRFQRNAMTAMTRGAETMQAAIITQIRTVEDSIAARRAAAVTGARTTDGAFGGISGPAGGAAVRSGRAGAAAGSVRGLDRELAEIAAGGASAGARGSAAAARAQAAAQAMMGVVEESTEFGTVSEVADTLGVLVSDVHWWWPSRLDESEIRQDDSPHQLYMQRIVLHAISSRVSFLRDPLCVQEASSSGSLTSPISVVLNALGLMALSLNDVPLKLNGLELVNVLAGNQDLGQRIAQHYVSSGLSEVYKVVFASDILGNPVGVVTALGTGVRDFFVEPAQGLVRSPAEFGRGLMRGTGSLMTHTVVGLGVGVSSLASSVSRGVATLAFDAEYIRDRAERAARHANHRPAHLGEALLDGGREFGRGMALGVAGVVMQPIRGAEEEGVTGFVKGVGKGVAGLVAKPVAGALDLASRMTEGIVATAKYMGGRTRASGPVVRRRHQRLMWGIDRALIPHEPLHNIIIDVMRKALEVAAATESENVDGQAAVGAVNKMAQLATSGQVKSTALVPAASAGAASTALVARAAGAGAASSKGSKASGAAAAASETTSSVLSEMRDLMTGRDAALRAALVNISSTYMHHIFWPHSPYLLIITTRAVIFARVNRAAASTPAAFATMTASSLQGQSLVGSGQVVNLCWQAGVVTPAALAAASEAHLAPTKTPGADSLKALAEAASAASAHKRGRIGAATGALAGHVAYTNLIDSLAEMSADAAASVEAARKRRAAAAREAAAAAGAVGGADGSSLALVPVSGSSTAIVAAAGAASATAAGRRTSTAVAVPAPSGKRARSMTVTVAVGASASAKKKVRVRSTPLAIMALDSLVQQNFNALGSLPPDHPAFCLPRHLLDSMITDVEPMPLYFADAIATIANVRPDASPKNNVHSVTIALAYIDQAYVRYCRERAAYAEAHPQLGIPTSRIEHMKTTRGLEPDDLTPLFNYIVAKSSIDRPVLCGVLATMWLRQHGLHSGRDGHAMTMFTTACAWVAAIATETL